MLVPLKVRRDGFRSRGRHAAAAPCRIFACETSRHAREIPDFVPDPCARDGDRFEIPSAPPGSLGPFRTHGVSFYSGDMGNTFGDMTAAMLVLGPIFEADLPSELYAYRPGRNAQQAVVEVEELLFRGHPEVVDADLADYFGSIPHAELLKSVSRRIVDRRALHLIRMWLDCPVEETDDRGRKTRTTEARDKRSGIPQGSPLSPLLANIYMRRFVLGWKMFGLERSLGTRLITYADDLVILCRRGKAEAALATTAGDHGQAEADGERGEDTDLQGAGRRVRLPGIHVRANVFGEDRPGPYRLPAVKEKHSAGGRESPRADRPIGNMARDHNVGE